MVTRGDALPVIAVLVTVAGVLGGLPVVEASADAGPERTPIDTSRGSESPSFEAAGEDAYQLTIGGADPGMAILLNVSMLTNLPDAGTFRFASHATLDGTRIVEVSIALHFEGFENLSAFLSDPLGHFSFDVVSDLDLPSFGSTSNAGGSP